MQFNSANKYSSKQYSLHLIIKNSYFFKFKQINLKTELKLKSYYDQSAKYRTYR